jgi:hypothetical protein
MNRREFISSLGAVSVAAATLPAGSLVARGGPRAVSPAPNRLQAFDYRGVKLLPGRFQRQMEQARRLYFNLSNDDLLKGFRRDAGLPAPGNDLKGWAQRRCDATFGQWLSGMARLSCALDDPALREKAVTLADGWKQTLGKSGNCRMGTYAWEKMAGGLVDLALYANYDPELNLLEQITGWASRQFDRSRSPATPLDRDGRKPQGTLEWYTLSENSYRAYLLTGREVFRTFGDLWLYPSYWDKFLKSSAPAGAEYLHAYSHINTFCGVAMAYAVTGEERCLQILRNAYDYATQTQAYASGAYGPGEWSVPADGTLGRALEIRPDSAEVPCGSWAGFKLSRYLLGFTGESKYAGWMETLLYNGIGAALPVQPDGRTFYYADYRLGAGTKLYHWDEWPCCSGTYIQCVADYHNLIYFRNDEGLYVNLFVPSEATWTHSQQPVTVRQETKFPEADEVLFAFQADKPVNLTLRVRIPAWSPALAFTLNENEPVQFKTEAEGWAAIQRTWAPGDKLKLKLSPGLQLAPVDAAHPRRAAVKYGPVLLAQEARYTYPLELRGDDLAARFSRQSDDLHFGVSDLAEREQHTGMFKPFYQVPERLPYRIYFDLDSPRFL